MNDRTFDEREAMLRLANEMTAYFEVSKVGERFDLGASELPMIERALRFAATQASTLEQFITDLAGSVDLVKATPKQREMFKASLRFAISFAKQKAAHRVAVSDPAIRKGCIKEAFSGESCLDECKDSRDCAANSAFPAREPSDG